MNHVVNSKRSQIQKRSNRETRNSFNNTFSRLLHIFFAKYHNKRVARVHVELMKISCRGQLTFRLWLPILIVSDRRHSVLCAAELKYFL